MKNKAYFLALNRMNQIGPLTVKKLLERWPYLEELFQLSLTQMEKEGLPTRLAAIIRTFDISEIEQDLKWEQEENHHLLTWEDPDYPELLKEIYDPPIVLYAKGKLDSLKQKTIAIIGTRKPSITGRETARKFAYDLAKLGQLTIVSGLATGIDANAHWGCIEGLGRTIAVMGTGIDKIYPSQHLQLAEKITENGLLLSEFPLKKAANAGHFPRRNRIISGLSLSILVVEAAKKSGSLITARFALEQNRDVLAIPSSILNPQARGCHQLLQQGAKLVTSSEEILQDLLSDNYIKQEETQPLLANYDKNLVKFMGFEVTTINKLCQRTGLSTDKISCILAELELQGIVKAVTGGYVRCI
jgi:DNA processing protein